MDSGPPGDGQKNHPMTLMDHPMTEEEDDPWIRIHELRRVQRRLARRLGDLGRLLYDTWGVYNAEDAMITACRDFVVRAAIRSDPRASILCNWPSRAR